MSRSGGLWLFSDGDTETKVVDAIYRIAWHVTPYNQRDESWLRATMQDVRGQEMDSFLQLLGNTTNGQASQQEWNDWTATCECTWAHDDDDPIDSYFPTRRTEAGIADDCQVHRVIEACGDYCDLVDRDWREIPDWYHLGERPKRGVGPETRHREWRAGVDG